MTVQQALNWAYEQLNRSASKQLDAELLLGFVLKKPREFLFTYPAFSVTTVQMGRFSRLISRRKKREPIAYILGQKEFFGLIFYVTKGVLVPRPETEEVVEEVIRLMKGRTQPKIVDVGVGSGAIAIALQHALPHAHIFGSDSSRTALAVARKNATVNTTKVAGGKVNLRLGSLLSPFPNQKFECIVSNPPYLTANEMKNPDLSFEPKQALFGGKKGVEVYQQLFEQVGKHLQPNGYVVLEIGYTQAKPLTRLAKKLWPNVQVSVKKDLAGLDRVLTLKIPSVQVTEV